MGLLFQLEREPNLQPVSHTLKDVCIKFEEVIKGQMLIGTFAEAVVPTKGL